MKNNTTGQTISRLGVLTVLANNAIEANYLPPAKREAAGLEIEKILSGGAGIDEKKIAVRSLERCAVGGAAFAFGPVTFGWN